MASKYNYTTFRSYARRALTPFTVLFISLLLTVMSVYFVHRVAVTEENRRYEAEITRTRNAIFTKANTYIALLRAGSGLFASKDVVTAIDFKQFVSALNLEKEYPGIQGIGYSKRLSSESLADFNKTLDAFSQPKMKIYPDYPREEYHAIVYLEPQDQRNQVAIGYDMYTEPVRRQAMERARDTGEVTLSGKVTLVQEIDQNVQPGFLMYYPYYGPDTDPSSVEARRKYLDGFVYSPFRATDFFSSILPNPKSSPVSIAVFDGSIPSDDTLLYNSAGNVSVNELLSSPSAAVERIMVAGRMWSLVFTASDAFTPSTERYLLPLILFSGLAISYILFLIYSKQWIARIQTERYARDLLLSQEKLSQSEERFRLISENARDLISMTNEKGQYVYVSPSFKKLLGYSLNELLNMSPDDLVHPEDRDLVENWRNVGSVRYRMRKKNGSYIWFEGTSYPVTVGSLRYTARSARDISDRIELERQKDEFFAMVSHELKTPVTALKAYTQVLYRQFVKENEKKKAAQLEKMNAQLDKLALLIGDLLDVSKIEAGKLALHKERFELMDLVKEIVGEMQLTTEKHRIIIKGNGPITINGDRDRIGQVLTNLISNAIKYSPRAKTIDVKVKPKQDEASVCVTDYGIGIPSDKIERIFDRFFRVNEKEIYTFPGLGLGLYISSQIIKRHRGTLSVKSEFGKGSTFCFTLPAVKRLKK